MSYALQPIIKFGNLYLLPRTPKLTYLQQESVIFFSHVECALLCSVSSQNQLEDGHTLFDYSVGLNEIIQLMIRKVLPVATLASPSNGDSSTSDEVKDEPMDAAGEEAKEVWLCTQCMGIYMYVHGRS